MRKCDQKLHFQLDRNAIIGRTWICVPGVIIIHGSTTGEPMRSAVFCFVFAILAGPALSTSAAAQGSAPDPQCELARRDWAANYPPMPPESRNDRLAYLDRATATAKLRFDLNCDHRLSFEEYLPMAWEGWRWKVANGDGVVTQAEYVANWCVRRLRGLDSASRATCEEASASEYRKIAGSRRSRGVDQQGYRGAASALFRRADRNRDGYLTSSRNPAEAYE